MIQSSSTEGPYITVDSLLSTADLLDLRPAFDGNKRCKRLRYWKSAYRRL